MGPSSALWAGHSHPRCPHSPSRARPELGTARTGGDVPGPPAASGPAWVGTAQSGLSPGLSPPSQSWMGAHTPIPILQMGPRFRSAVRTFPGAGVSRDWP